MSKKPKLETRNLKLEELLNEAGFSKVRKINGRILHASGAEDFGKAHAAFLQAACKSPELIGCSRFETVPAPVLVVHRSVAAEVGDQMSEVSEPEAPEAENAAE